MPSCLPIPLIVSSYLFRIFQVLPLRNNLPGMHLPRVGKLTFESSTSIYVVG